MPAGRGGAGVSGPVSSDYEPTSFAISCRRPLRAEKRDDPMPRCEIQDGPLWAGIANRMLRRHPLEILRRVRAATGTCPCARVA